MGKNLVLAGGGCATMVILANRYRFILSRKTWSSGPGQSSSALPEEFEQEFEVN